MEVQSHLAVQCKRCGILNRKKVEDYEVECRRCGTITAFRIIPPWAVPPQPQSLLLKYDEETEYLTTPEGRKDSEEWKVIVKDEEKEAKEKRDKHYKFEDKFKKEKMK